MEKRIYLVLKEAWLINERRIPAGAILGEIKPLAPYCTEDADIAIQSKAAKSIIVAPDENVEEAIKRLYSHAEYILKSDTTEPKTIFILRNLSDIEKFVFLASLVGVSEDDKGNKIPEVNFRADTVRTILTKCIAEIKNFGEYKTIGEAIDRLPVHAIPELLIRCLILK